MILVPMTSGYSSKQSLLSLDDIVLESKPKLCAVRFKPRKAFIFQKRL